MKWLVLVLALCGSPCIFGQQLLNLFHGDSCKTPTVDPGVCTYITECPQVLADIQNRGKFPNVFCGFHGTKSIVCCPSNLPTSTTRKPTTTSTRTTSTTSTTTQRSTSPSIASRNPGTISREKCKEYSKYVNEKEDSPLLSIFSSSSTNTNECPFDKETLIVGGKKASRREFPHMVQLGFNTGSTTSWSCGGSIISEYYILTAAHCLEDREKGAPKLARSGLTNVSDTAHVQVREVESVIKYPEFVSMRYHDIGLIKVRKPFNFDTFSRPACLQTSTQIPYENAIASGWGKTEFAGSTSDDLLKVVLELFTNTQCNKTYRREINQPGSPLNRGIVDELMICAGSSKELKDTCNGDSGGPLQVYQPDTPDTKCMYSIIGVTSFGKACGLAKNAPGVYTRVSHYIQWIENTV